MPRWRSASEFTLYLHRAEASLACLQVEACAVPLQRRDAWDATPLYYAAFTGNVQIIEYLLARGAKCEQKVYDTTM